MLQLPCRQIFGSLQVWGHPQGTAGKSLVEGRNVGPIHDTHLKGGGFMSL